MGIYSGWILKYLYYFGGGGGGGGEGEGVFLVGLIFGDGGEGGIIIFYGILL